VNHYLGISITLYIFILLRECERKEQAAVIGRQSLGIQQQLIDDTILDMVEHAAYSVHKDTALEKKSELSIIKEDIKRAKLAACFKQ